jgi:hypothetical protein
MAIIFKQTSGFELARSKIEQYIYNSVLSIEADEMKALAGVSHFNHSFYNLLNILEAMYISQTCNDENGEKSFPIKSGRYRVFYYVKLIKENDFEITFLDIDDNHQSNIDRFPSHLTQFDEFE